MNSFPDWTALLNLWLQTHHKGQPAVVFCNPLGDPTNITSKVKLMRKFFGDDKATDLIHRSLDKLVGAEYAVLVCSSMDEARRIMQETPKEQPYALVWDGSEITGHH